MIDDVFSFFFNETAPTEIDKDLHTLTLHVALPIWPALPACADQARAAGTGKARLDLRTDHLPGQRSHPRRLHARAAQPQSALPRRQLAAGRHHRPEEHTSELQPPMRISYAVFCLKKKQ